MVVLSPGKGDRIGDRRSVTSQRDKGDVIASLIRQKRWHERNAEIGRDEADDRFHLNGWSGLSGHRLILPSRSAGIEIRNHALRHGILPEFMVFHDAAIDRLLVLARRGDRVLLVTEGATGIRMEGIVFRPIMDGGSPATLDLALCWRNGENDPVLARLIDLARPYQEEVRSFPGVGVGDV